MNAAKEYTVAIGDKLSQALESRSLELTSLQVVPSTPGKIIIRGMVHRPLAMQDKMFAVEVAGDLEKVNHANISSFIDHILPRIVDAFFGDAANSEAPI